MKKLKLVIKEKGMYIRLPGMAAFRTPAKVDVTKIKMSTLTQVLHSHGVSNYELTSVSKTGEILNKWTKDDINLSNKKQKEEPTNINSDKLDRLETILLTLVSKKDSEKNKNSEQIINRLLRIESILKSGGQFTSHFDVNNKIPVVEEMEDQYIPDIDISDMQIKGKTSETIERLSKKDIDDTVDLLSNLTKNGGK